MAQAELNALIVASLKDLDEAAYHLENRMQAEVGTAMDEVADRERLDLGWDGHADWDDDSIWVAPIAWKKPDGSSGDSHTSQYSFEQESDELGDRDYFWLTQLVGLGHAKLGFRWSRNDVSKVRWRKAVGQNTDVIAEARSLGFVYFERDGSFFLPVIIDPVSLAAAMAEETPALALDTFAQAFAVLAKAAPLFDRLLTSTLTE